MHSALTVRILLHLRKYKNSSTTEISIGASQATDNLRQQVGLCVRQYVAPQPYEVGFRCV